MDRTQLFNQHRDYLFSIAYRMLGSAMDAEDMVQDTFFRWEKATQEEIDSPKAYLASIVTRLCIDYLRSARVQRESYLGPWLPEPILTEQAPDASEALDLSESISMAFLVLLESLSPTERAVFLLREVFNYSYAEVAKMVNKTEGNCRQMIRRARQHIEAGRPRYTVSPEAQQALTMQFTEACVSGDLASLMTMLADDVSLWSDGGGKAIAATRPLHGPEKVAQFLMGIARKAPPNTTTQFAHANGQPSIIIYIESQPTAVMTIEIGYAKDGKTPVVTALRNILNPDKLHRIPPLS